MSKIKALNDMQKIIKTYKHLPFDIPVVQDSFVEELSKCIVDNSDSLEDVAYFINQIFNIFDSNDSTNDI